MVWQSIDQTSLHSFDPQVNKYKKLEQHWPQDQNMFKNIIKKTDLERK